MFGPRLIPLTTNLGMIPGSNFFSPPSNAAITQSQGVPPIAYWCTFSRGSFRLTTVKGIPSEIFMLTAELFSLGANTTIL